VGLTQLKDPHNIAARRFALKAKQKHRAIICMPGCDPRFWDISIRDHCNEGIHSFTGCFGETYINDTPLAGRTFFTGSNEFTAKEIEVFEVTN
jgi:hypothetical protein